MSFLRRNGPDRISAWLERWGPLVPILLAEFIVLLGFGALLPVMPLFIQEQGIDATMLGIIIAGWPIGKLFFEPLGGWFADRHSRKPQLVLGMALIGVTSVAMLLFTTALALFVLRFIAGAAAGIYDSAARGTIVDATDEDERGEAFGFYAAFQMGGFVIGPAIGAFAAALVGGYWFPFILTGAMALLAAGLLLVAQPRRPHVVEDERFEHHPDVEPAILPDVNFGATTTPRVTPDDTPTRLQAPLGALVNRVLVAAVIIGFGMQLSFGTYEVVWSIYLIDLGASIEWVGFTFVLFALPSMIISPIAGRLVDRRGPMPFVIGSSVAVVVAGTLYAIATEFVFPSLVVPIEATATAILSTALFTLVALGTPRGRASTAQGIYGASGTIALIVASIVAGALWERGSALPFWFFVAGMAICLVLGLLVYYGHRLRRAPELVTAASE